MEGRIGRDYRDQEYSEQLEEDDIEEEDQVDRVGAKVMQMFNHPDLQK